jgi:DNA-directed RNA polymerase specialized sigma24 family protein
MTAGTTANVSAPTVEQGLDQRELRTLMGAAAYQARRVARTLKLSQSEREDAEQDILLALLERRRFFDPARGLWSPFAHRIARQAAQSVADALAATRRIDAVPLDQPTVEMVQRQEEPVTLGETIADDTAPGETDIRSRLMLIRFVAKLPRELRLAAEATLMADGDLADAQRRSGLSTSEFYRRLREIRYRLICEDLARVPRNFSSYRNPE